jgi:hypothetical protein
LAIRRSFDICLMNPDQRVIRSEPPEERVENSHSFETKKPGYLSAAGLL